MIAVALEMTRIANQKPATQLRARFRLAAKIETALHEIDSPLVESSGSNSDVSSIFRSSNSVSVSIADDSGPLPAGLIVEIEGGLGIEISRQGSFGGVGDAVVDSLLAVRIPDGLDSLFSCTEYFLPQPVHSQSPSRAELATLTFSPHLGHEKNFTRQPLCHPNPVSIECNRIIHSPTKLFDISHGQVC